MPKFSFVSSVGSSLADAWLLAHRYEMADTQYGYRPDFHRTEAFIVRVVDGAISDVWATRVPLWGFVPTADGGFCTLASRFGASRRLAEDDCLLVGAPGTEVAITPHPIESPGGHHLIALADGQVVAWSLGESRVASFDGAEEARLGDPPVQDIVVMAGTDVGHLLAVSERGEAMWRQGSTWSEPVQLDPSPAWPIAAFMPQPDQAVVIGTRGAWKFADGAWSTLATTTSTLVHGAGYDGEVLVLLEGGGLARLDNGQLVPAAVQVSGHALHAGADALLVTSELEVTEIRDGQVGASVTIDDVEAAIGSRLPLWKTKALESDRSRVVAPFPKVPGVHYEPVRYGLSEIVGESLDEAWILGRRTDDVHRPNVTEGESFVARVVGGQIESLVTSGAWIWALQRSPSGRVYVGAFTDSPGGVWRTPQDGALVWEHLDAPASQGLFVFDDECVISWAGDELHLFEGQHFRPIPAPGGRVLAMHGCARDWIVAVGPDGLCARWDGQAWHRWTIPRQGTLSRIHVVSEDEMYATGPNGVLLEGSRHGWAERAPLEGMGNGVAKWRDEVYVADPVQGLLRLSKDQLELVELPVFPVNFHATSEALLMIENRCYSETRDLEAVRRIDVRDLEIAMRDIDPSWR